MNSIVLPSSIKKIDVAEARHLRHKILRPHQPPEACVYPGDDAPATAHFGAFQEKKLVGIATVFNEPRAGEDDPKAWRIRGMATEEAVRGDGYGGALLEACIAYVEEEGGRTIWCNARTTVMGFYAKYGFTPLGDEFDLPGIGPHFLMIRESDS